ncbi:4-phosphoerythronate dehydrogenase [Marinobacter bryozoorum]|uniref:4-phosphoerythronate dehydrogenase n=1 Tax=Marinobacter bryozoorum TaxID=256324 RepID=UPI002004AFDF|nr:4-phosphoerythronate dehydrogenase [Marinobacter bryozoorum]MCK7544230.1 4-phosphoerythronate dehydrogenase [Marinobacter bryozoorum]
MRIVADENIPLLEAFCGDLGTLTRVNGRNLGRDQLLDADVLLVRSVTRVDQGLLADTPVRFVGTATIGTDHIDTDWLKARGIAFASAPGCNANSVVQYVLSVLSLFLQRSEKRTLDGLTVGVIGAGNVGGTLTEVLAALGITVRVSDPPLEASGAERPFASLDDVLACDVISLHTPLVEVGLHPTSHLLDRQRLAGLCENQLLINSGRGAVVDNRALLERLQQADAPLVALDVWENEPSPLPDLLERCWLATPHIAGYSVEGKSRGTEMVAQALHQWAGVPMSASLDNLLPPPPVSGLALTAQCGPLEALHRALMTCYDPRDDDARLRKLFAGAAADTRPSFDQLRRDYPVRREPASMEVRLEGHRETARLLSRAGFRVTG